MGAEMLDARELGNRRSILLSYGVVLIGSIAYSLASVQSQQLASNLAPKNQPANLTIAGF
jgi:hypothetical protein